MKYSERVLFLSQSKKKKVLLNDVSNNNIPDSASGERGAQLSPPDVFFSLEQK